MTKAEEKQHIFNLLVMNILSDIVLDRPDETTKRHVQRLFDNELEEPVKHDPVNRIADEIFGNVPHDTNPKAYNVGGD